jgi:hypothetical protein
MRLIDLITKILNKSINNVPDVKCSPAHHDCWSSGCRAVVKAVDKALCELEPELKLSDDQLDAWAAKYDIGLSPVDLRSAVDDLLTSFEDTAEAKDKQLEPLANDVEWPPMQEVKF